jgi:copper resistance protein D
VPPVPDTLSVVLRAVSFVLLLQAAGMAIFAAVFGDLMAGGLAALRLMGGRLALAAMVFVAGHFGLEAARMAGEMSGAVDPAMQMMALHSSMGAAFALRMIGLTLLAVGFFTGARAQSDARATPAALAPSGAPRAGPGALTLVGAVLAVCAFAFTGHTSDHAHRWASAAFLLIHLLVVAFWIGALWPLYAATIKEAPAAAARLIDAFSAVAAWVVPCILFAGIGLTVILVPTLSVFSQPYGRLLLAKVGLFAVLMGLAALNKWTFGPDIGRGDAAAARAFRWTVAIEYFAICAVLVVTAVMTTFYSPAAA